MKEIILGQSKYGEIVIAEINEDRVIRGFNEYQLITSDQSYDNNEYLTCCGWGHKVTINGVDYNSGDVLPEDIKPHYESDLVKDIIEGEEYYMSEGFYCDECGTFHDSGQYYDLSFIITDHGEVLCKGCAKMDDLLIEVSSPKDIFASKDLTNIETLDEYEEVETLFCDSSGFGRETERAMTPEQAERRVADLLDQYGELYSGLTGIGQFQVYVTLYRKVA